MLDDLHPVHFKKRDPSTVPQTRIADNDAFEKIYTVGRELGKGAFGVVRLVTHKKTRQKFAVKLIEKSLAGSSGVSQLEREVDIMKTIEHPHCVNLFEVYESPQKMYLVMEYASGGELLEQLMERGFYPEDEARLIVKRLASSVAYLHAQDIVHRDIKLENLLIAPVKNEDGDEDEMNIKLSDFGLSIQIGRDDTFMSQTCGTPMYMAPEVIDEKGYSKTCDVWSIGVIMYFCLAGQPPFFANNEAELYRQIRAADMTFSEDAWVEIPQTAKSLISAMLRPDPASRISAKEIIDHPWIRGVDEDDGPNTILEMMKSYNLERRFRKAQNFVLAAQRFMYGIKTKETSTAESWGNGEARESVCETWDLGRKLTDTNACGNYGEAMVYDDDDHLLHRPKGLSVLHSTSSTSVKDAPVATDGGGSNNKDASKRKSEKSNRLLPKRDQKR